MVPRGKHSSWEWLEVASRGDGSSHQHMGVEMTCLSFLFCVLPLKGVGSAGLLL